MGKLMLNDRCYTGSDNLLVLNDESYSGGKIANLIEKNIIANGTYNASADGADGYSEVNVNVQAKLNPVAFTDATHIEQRNRTITISDYEAVAQIVTDTTYCTGVITLPVTNFTKTEFVMEYSITTPSAVGGNYFARCFFSDNVPSDPWTQYENYGYTQLAQSSSDWEGILQRLEIPDGASYFNIELGGTSFSSIKLYEEAQPTLVSKTITENGTYLAHTDSAYGYSEIDVEVPGGLIITDLIPTPATADSTEPFANTQWDANAAAWHAFDKDISTCWASGNGMAGNWQIGYAFHEPVVVNRVKIINRDDATWGVSQAPQVFWIYGSNDGENWTEVSSGGHIWTGLNEEFIYDFENNVAYSIWKIHTKLSMAGATGNLSLSIIGFYNRTYLPASHDASSLEDLHSLSNTSRVVIPGNYYLAISKVADFTLDGISVEQGSKSDSIYFFYDSYTYCIIGKATTDLISHSGTEDASIGLVALTGPVDNYEWSTETASISADIDDIFLYISAYGTGNGNWVSSGADIIDVNDFIYSRTSGRSAWLLKATSTTITMRNAGIFLKLRNISDES